MTKLINILTTVATVAMAAVPLSAIGTVAHAAEVRGTRVAVADLDLSSPADAVRFQARVDEAAHQVCRDYGRGLNEKNACRAAVREEAVERLGAAQRESLKLATQGKTIDATWRVAGF